ncbi:uncharacterized protein [Miscanthus floridulus]|uniref:uncharacterized protein n=1 Tax=Miscanthus floridulus TaxID=154761 RepID=UPI0034575116
MATEFEMSMIGELSYFLGLQIKQMKNGTFMSKGKYIKDMLKKFGMNDAKIQPKPTAHIVWISHPRSPHFTARPPSPSVCLCCSKDGSGPASPSPLPQTPSRDKEKPPHQHPQQASFPGAAASLQPPRPWNLRTARVEIGRFGEGVRAGVWRAPAAAGGGPAHEEGLRRAHQGRDHRGLRRHPRQPPAAAAQEAPARRAAPVNMLYPGLSLTDVNLDSYKIDETCLALGDRHLRVIVTEQKPGREQTERRKFLV